MRRELRARLAVTEPVHMEPRDAFVVRLRAAVAWVNKHRKAYLLELCTSDKARVRDVLDATVGQPHQALICCGGDCAQA